MENTTIKRRMTGLGLKWPGDGVAASVLQGIFVKFSAGGGFRQSNFETRRTKAIEPPDPRQQRREYQTMDKKVGAQVARGFVWAVDCSKSAIAVSLGQKVVLALMAIGEKGQSNLWLNPRMLPSLGSVGIQLGTCK